jgi:hypothetical protein
MKSFILGVSLAAAMGTVVMAQDENQPLPPRFDRENEVELFNGKDFTGLTFCLKNHADPSRTWSVTNSVIHCTGTPGGYLRTTQSYSNYFLTVIWRFTKVAPGADSAGILVQMQPPDKVWPQCIQVQGKHGHLGDLILMEGAECQGHPNMGTNATVSHQGLDHESPVGDWNTSETICVNRSVTSFINGYLVNEISDTSVTSGFIGAQSDGGDIEIRRMYFTPLKYSR